MSGDAEQPQEGELDHAHWGALRVHIGELQRKKSGQQWLTALGGSHRWGKDWQTPVSGPEETKGASKVTQNGKKGQDGQGPAARTCVTSSLGVTHVSPPAVKLQNTRKASRAQPWLGSTQYSPVGGRWRSRSRRSHAPRYSRFYTLPSLALPWRPSQTRSPVPQFPTQGSVCLHPASVLNTLQPSPTSGRCLHLQY